MLRAMPDRTELRICLNHSQSLLEQSMNDLEWYFHKWASRPFSRTFRQRLLLELSDFRWMLETHFMRVVGQEFLKPVIEQKPNLSEECRRLEEWQATLLNKLDRIVADVESMTANQPVADRVLSERLAHDFESLHQDVMCEEKEECHLVEQAFD
jgi:hypothetical protein